MPEKTSESALERMRTEWDARARENAFHYVASSRETWTAEEFYASGRESVDAHILNDAARLFRRGDPKQLTMLEIGCGAGRMTRALAATFGEVHAVDCHTERFHELIEEMRGAPIELPGHHQAVSRTQKRVTPGGSGGGTRSEEKCFRTTFQRGDLGFHSP